MEQIKFTLNSRELIEQWEYRGEGNANLAISLPQTKQILRIRKTAGNSPEVAKIQIENETTNLLFYNQVIKPLLHPYICNIEPVTIKSSDIDVLQGQLEIYRPANRRQKRLDYSGISILIDYCFLPEFLLSDDLSEDTFTVELKPKQGFIHDSYAKDNIYCIYCQNQHLKFNQGKIQSVGKYCPLDLFSGDTEKIKLAIKYLTENPQNNLKLLKNGRLAFGELNLESSHLIASLSEIFHGPTLKLEGFCKLLQTILTTPFLDNSRNFPKINCQKCQYVTHGNVLGKILSLQKLDEYESLDFPNINNNDNWEYLNYLLTDISQRIDGQCVYCKIKSYLKFPKESREYKIPYLISAIAKDCSIMITFKKIKPGVTNFQHKERVVEVEGEHFLVNVGVIDLFPKPEETIQKHIKRNQEISQYNIFLKV